MVVQKRNINGMIKKYYDVENVIGLSKKEATSKLKDFVIEYSGSGDNVINQSQKVVLD